jgi:IS605 OrfB family transposase
VILTQKQIINKNHSFYKEIDEMSFKCKNLYNSVIYIYRQIFFSKIEDKKTYPSAFDLMRKFTKEKQFDFYNIGNTMVSQQVIKQAAVNWFSYLKALKQFYKNKTPKEIKPKPPNYKNVTKGRFIVNIPDQRLSKKELNNKIVKPTFMNIHFPFKSDGNVKCLRLVPKNSYYVAEIVYSFEDVPLKEDGNIMSIDLGLNRLMSCAVNNGKGLLFNGKPLKSINQFYNKTISKAKSLLKKDQFTSHKINNLWKRREFKIKDYLHKQSRKLIEKATQNDVFQIIIGNNKNWKQNINIGKKNNQNFVNIPYHTLIQMIEYKAKMKGISVLTTEESYTSQANSISRDNLFVFGEKPNEYTFFGIRKKGNYISASGLHFNADVNGAINIMRKATQVDQSSDYLVWARGCVVNPVYVN